jgi:hypothetical protein
MRGAVPGPSEDAVMTISLHEMKAWWAFTEMKSQRTRSFYHDSRVPMMQRKLKGLDFANVAMPDRDVLVEMWEPGRGKFLWMYLVDVSGFTLENWSATQLSKVSKMREMDPERGRFFSMLTYATSPRPTGPGSERDPRVVADRLPLSAKELQAGDPVIVGLYHEGRQVLIDGYTRGVRFIQCAGATNRIPVLVPIAADAAK